MTDTITDRVIETGQPASATVRKRSRRWPMILAAVLLLATAGLGIMWSQRGAHQASLDDAAEQFRRGAGTTTGAPALLVPAAGVYRYTGSGTEHISLLGTEQKWGAELPVTITHGDPGCWTYRVDYSSNHWQDTTYCGANGVLQEHRGQTFQRFDFGALKVDDTTEFTCTPPADTVRLAAVPGDSWTQVCTGHSPSRNTTVTSSGVNTYIGPEDVRVGGDDLPAFHYQYGRTLSGDQKGTEKTDVWFATDTGQLLRTHRDVNVASPSPIGDVIYTEVGDYTLADRTPQS